ncbi:putative signal peptide protein [Puccinia sorghi]|uniref:Putative signal peptide protein n=1 Tax=Puccinia sorghi TaxID=27349 RepID=A0A0L6UVE3_9BASI|nr:putative signal peptide protein [Puccinia sorghi]
MCFSPSPFCFSFFLPLLVLLFLNDYDHDCKENMILFKPKNPYERI